MVASEILSNHYRATPHVFTMINLNKVGHIQRYHRLDLHTLKVSSSQKFYHVIF